MTNLAEKIADFSDDKLLEMHADLANFTEEAAAVITNEISARGIDVNAKASADVKVAAGESDPAKASVRHINRDEFTALESQFSKADITAADAILRDGNFLFFIEQCGGGKTLAYAPVYKDAYTQASVLSSDVTLARFSVSVHNDMFEKARALIEEHFDIADDGCYAPRLSGVIDRLKRFSFSDVRFAEKKLRETLDVDFTPPEKNALAKLAALLLSEADAIEEEQGQMIFFYDSLEPLLEKINDGGNFTRADFLAIIEMCKLYCEDPRYDCALNGVAESILDFLTEC